MLTIIYLAIGFSLTLSMLIINEKAEVEYHDYPIWAPVAVHVIVAITWPIAFMWLLTWGIYLAINKLREDRNGI